MTDKILFDIPETFETDRLLLTIPRAGLGTKLHAAILDGYADYVKWLSWPTIPATIEAAEIECRKHHAEFVTREFIRYLILDKSTNEVVGRTAFPDFQANWAIPQFGISYFIRASARNKGFAAETSRAMTKLAFQNLNAKKVFILCDDENTASNKVPQKLGFELEYTQRGGWPRPDGQLANLHCYSLFSLTQLK